jgi:hypothetical protein
MEIDAKLAKRVLEVVDAGLCNGMGNPRPGEMCVEAAVCYAMDLPHGDNPSCVSPAIRQLKITLNDANWSSNTARAKGLRRLAVLQLGSKDNFNDVNFVQRLVPLAKKYAANAAKYAKYAANAAEYAKYAEYAANAAANAANAAKYATNAAKYAEYAANAAANAAKYAANGAEYAKYAEYAANAAANAANAMNAAEYAMNAAEYAANAANAARDKTLADFAEDVVQILIEMKAPGVQFLSLTEE